jgi:hypothetical protein
MKHESKLLANHEQVVRVLGGREDRTKFKLELFAIVSGESLEE